MAIAIFDDHGIRFEYPPDWEIEVSDDGPRHSVTIQSPDGPAFALVTVDASRPSPGEMADEALNALREEYPQLEASPASDTIDGHRSVGHDVEFFSLDMTNNCVIRCFRSPRRTTFVLTQWSDAEENDPEVILATVRKSIEETDS